jgi:hypothetical protein
MIENGFEAIFEPIQAHFPPETKYSDPENASNHSKISPPYLADFVTQNDATTSGSSTESSQMVTHSDEIRASTSPTCLLCNRGKGYLVRVG